MNRQDEIACQLMLDARLNSQEHDAIAPGEDVCCWCFQRLNGKKCPVTPEQRKAEVARVEAALWGPPNMSEIYGIGFWIEPQPDIVVEK